jgi:hypothetical protein
MQPTKNIPRAPLRSSRTMIFLLFIAVMFFLIPNPAASWMQDSTLQENQAGRYFRRYNRVFMDLAETSRRVRVTGKLSLATGDGVFDITLTPHDVRAPLYRAEEAVDNGGVRLVIPEEIRTYRGTVSGLPGSEARFTVRDNFLEGVVFLSNESYVLEPMRNYDSSAASNDMITYRASDIRPEALGHCAASLANRINRAKGLVVPNNLGAGASLSIANVATEADFEYVQSFGSSAAANNSILEIMNQVDGIFSSQFSLSLRVVYQHTWATASDPYNSSAAGFVLNEFQSYWNANFGDINFDLAHMWTGKQMDGSIIGTAYVGVACTSRSYSYGVSQQLGSAPGKYILTAHEIGHNFGATDADQTDPPQPSCYNTIMDSLIGTGKNFCPYSTIEILSHISKNPSCYASFATAAGACGPVSCQVISVTSNEPMDGDGDWQLRGDPRLKRAEKSDKGNDRTYTIAVRCTDSQGNSDIKTVPVTVPNDQGH